MLTELDYSNDMTLSGVATGVARGQSATPDSEKFAKNWEKRLKKSAKLGKKRKNREEKANREGSFTLPLLTDGLATLLMTLGGVDEPDTKRKTWRQVQNIYDTD